jgi:outer membrane protein OmpA-like peptidoglycan-associated protein
MFHKAGVTIMSAVTRFILRTIVLCFAGTFAIAQVVPSTSPRWGLHAGGNYNMAGVGYGNWAKDPNRNGPQFSELVYNDGQGGGLYTGLMLQGSITDALHVGTRISYDNRSFVANDDKSFPKPGTILTTGTGQYFNDEYTFHTDYLTLEPFLKYYLGSKFHLTLGVGLGLALNSTFDYAPEAGAKQSDLDIAQADSVKHKITGSGFAGVGYDFFLSDPTSRNQWILTPFVETSYMISQRGVNFTNQNSINDALSTVSVRAGLSLAFGLAEILETTAMPEPTTPSAPAPTVPSKLFEVVDPVDGVYSKRIERAEFPLRPYVFFDKESTEIPTRYNKISRAQTRLFATSSGLTADDIANVDVRPIIQRDIYYNILNVMGYRLSSIPGSSVELYASDPNNKDARAYAESVKKYLVEVWNVNPNQLTIAVGEADPKSGTARTPNTDLTAVSDENRRVQFRNMRPDQLGARVPVSSVRTAEADHEVYVDMTSMRNVQEWSAVISGNGASRSFGPFRGSSAYLDPTGLIGTEMRAQKYTLTVNAKLRDGTMRTQSEPITLVRTDREGTSTSHRLIFEYNEDDPVTRSRTFLVNNVVPQIRNNSKVYIYGHTDAVGGKGNLDLAMNRADQVMGIIKDQLNARGLTGVRFSASALGEDEPSFTNNLPEGRMYNRSVVIDVVP